jgi:hypothetical protein
MQAIVMLARLAVSIDHQGKGYGQKVLVSALRHAVKMTEPPHHLPAIAVVLDILDEDARGFYDNFDLFHEMCDNPMKLFVPMNADIVRDRIQAWCRSQIEEGNLHKKSPATSQSV